MIVVWAVFTFTIFLISIVGACFTYSDYLDYKRQGDLDSLRALLLIAALSWTWPVVLPIVIIYFFCKMVKTALTGKV